MPPTDDLATFARARQAANRIARAEAKARRESDARAFASIKALPAPLGHRFPSRYKAG